MCAKGFAEEGLGCRCIPLRTQAKIDGAAIPIHRTVEINPSASYL